MFATCLLLSHCAAIRDVSHEPRVVSCIGSVHVTDQDLMLCANPNRARPFLTYPGIYVPEGNNIEIAPVPRGTSLKIVAVMQCSTLDHAYCYPLLSFTDGKGNEWRRVDGTDIASSVAAADGPVFFNSNTAIESPQDNGADQ